MNRRELQQLSHQRRRDAKVLLDAGNYSGAYYLLGYAVECGIKAAIARNVQRHDFPDLNTVRDSYKHNLEGLLKTAGLWPHLTTAMAASQSLQVNWAVVKDWDVESRYTLSISEVRARDFYSASTSKTTGFLSWLRNYW